MPTMIVVERRFPVSLKRFLFFTVLISSIAIAIAGASNTASAVAAVVPPTGLFLAPEALVNFLGSGGTATSVVFLSPSDHLQDVFLPAAKSGRLKSLTLVMPTKDPLSDDAFKSWRSYVASLSPGSDNGFTLSNGLISGSIEGLKITVLPYMSWSVSDSSLVVVDVAFVAGLFVDESRTPAVDLPVKLLGILQERKVDVANVRLFLADRADIPLERDYLPKLTASVMRDPKAFSGGAFPLKWELLKSAESLSWIGLLDRASEHYNSYLKEEPEDASVLYRLALGRLAEGESEKGLLLLHRAYAADAWFIRGFAGAAFLLFRKGELAQAERVLRAGLHHDKEFPDLVDGLARVTFAQAKKMLAVNPRAAEERFAEIAGMGLGQGRLSAYRAEWEAALAAPPEAPGGAKIPSGHRQLLR